MAYTVDRLGKRFVRLSGDYINWKMKEGTNWNVINVGMLATFYAPSNNAGSLGFGLCQGTNGLGVQTPASFVGVYGTTTYVSATQINLYPTNAYACKIVAGSQTNGSAFAGNPFARLRASTADTEMLVMVGVQIDKVNGTVKYWDYGTSPTNTSLATFKTNMISPAALSSAITIATMPTDMDSINIYWSRSDYFLDVYAFDTYRVS